MLDMFTFYCLEIHNKDIVDILHLLVALKEHFSPNDPITPGVYMKVVVVQVGAPK